MSHPEPTTEREGTSLPIAGLPSGWDLGRDLCVLVGRGAGALARAFVEVGQARVIVVLPDGAEAEDVPDDVAVARSSSELMNVVLSMNGVMPAHLVVKKTDDAWASAEVHRRIAGDATTALRSRRVQLQTVNIHGPTWLLQGLENLDAIGRLPSISLLRDAFRDRPCVIVSPGPSLSRNVGQLAELKGHALLMTGSHTLHALAHAGVTPDLVVVADPGELGRHFDGTGAGAVEALIVGGTCRPECFEIAAPRRFSFACNGELDGWIYDAIGEDARLSTGGSVACSEFSLAQMLGCDPIVFVGQDLAFTDGRFYAAESLDGNAEIVAGENGGFILKKPAGAAGPGYELADGGLQFSREQGLVEVPGYDGGKVLTSRAFEAVLIWFEAVARSLEGRVRVVNSTEGGARIAGMEHLPLSAASAGWAERGLDVGAILDGAMRGIDPDERRRRLTDVVRDMDRSLAPCVQLAVRCRALALEAARRPAKLEQLARNERELSAAIQPLRCVSLLAHDEIIAAQEQGRTATDVAENLAAARRLFRVIERAGRVLREPLGRALEKLSRAAS